MEKEFVSYEQAVALQELGCGVILNYKYWRVEKKILVFHNDYNMQSIIDKGFDVECLNVYAPLKQQVFRWFRDKYRLYSTIIFRVSMEDNNEYWDWLIKGEEVVYRHFKTYEEAENACISKLIELTKQQDNDI